jgi:hypothetical protein
VAVNSKNRSIKLQPRWRALRSSPIVFIHPNGSSIRLRVILLIWKPRSRVVRAPARDMIEDNVRPGSTVGGDKNYDTAEFAAGCCERGCTPHVSQNDANRRSAILLTEYPRNASRRLTTKPKYVSRWARWTE